MFCQLATSASDGNLRLTLPLANCSAADEDDNRRVAIGRLLVDDASMTGRGMLDSFRVASGVAGTLLLASVVAAQGCGGRVDFGAAPVQASAGAASSAADSGAGGKAYRVEGECAPFHFEFTPGCGDCPTEPLTCPCINAVKASIAYERCIWGKCLQQLDCKVACGEKSGPVWVQPWQCLANLFCKDDLDCPNGRCVARRGGHCTQGLTGDDCADDADCINGPCVTVGPGLIFEVNTAGVEALATTSETAPPSRICQDGVVNSYCESDAQCHMGKCAITHITGQTRDLGVCTTGAAGEQCAKGSDCASGLVCDAVGSKLGWCR